MCVRKKISWRAVPPNRGLQRDSFLTEMLFESKSTGVVLTIYSASQILWNYLLFENTREESLISIAII